MHENVQEVINAADQPSHIGHLTKCRGFGKHSREIPAKRAAAEAEDGMESDSSLDCLFNALNLRGVNAEQALSMFPAYYLLHKQKIATSAVDF